MDRTGLGIAVLALGGGFASNAATARGDNDGAVAAAFAGATGLVTGAKAAPLTKHAVKRARVLIARGDDIKRRHAAVAVVRRGDDDGAGTGLGAEVARLGTGAVGGPAGHFAVDGARVVVAHNRLLDVTTRLAVALAGLRDVANTDTDTSTTFGTATAEGVPGRSDAVGVVSFSSTRSAGLLITGLRFD